jgi:hypothetical protein
MKLYGKIKSERAEKGQGGNDFLDIEISGENEEPVMTLHVEKDEDKYEVSTWNSNDVRLSELVVECKCLDPLCAKCLLLGCKDPNCKIHPENKKKEFREMYRNRK